MTITFLSFYVSFFLSDQRLHNCPQLCFISSEELSGTHLYKNFHSHLLPLLIHVSHTFKTASFSLEK